MKEDIIFNNESSAEHEILISKRINLPIPQRDITSINIPGRDGEVHIDNKRYSPVAIDIEFNYKSKEVIKKFREIKKWLRGDGILEFPDKDILYKVGKTEINSFSQIHERVAAFTVTFTCEPFAYTKEGQSKVKNPSSLFNDGYKTNPIFIITGEGMCTLTVNSNDLTVNVGQNVTIDTDKQIAYRTDGTIVNTTIVGDYEKIRFNEGNNTISISNGFDLQVIPNWRYL